MDSAGTTRRFLWRRHLCGCAAWGLLQTLACMCPAQAPPGGTPLPPASAPALTTPAAMPAPPPTSSNSALKSVPVLPPNVVLPILLNYSLWNNSLMMADVQINGSLERCIVDTGINACAVTPEAATRFKITPLATQATVITLNETRSAPETEFKNLKFNQIQFESLRAVILNASELYMGTAAADSPALWLGTPFLAAFQVTFDYTGHYIALDRPAAAAPKDKGAITLPLEIRDGRLYTRVSIPKGGTFSALINTGATGSLIPADVAAKLKIKPTKTFDVKWAGGKHGKASLITLPELRIGRLAQQQVPVLYFEPEGDAEVNRTLGVLGADVLSHYKVIINMAKKKMVLIPPPPPPKTDNTDADTKADKKPPQSGFGKPKK